MFFDITIIISQKLNIFSQCVSGTYGINCESRCDTCVNKVCDRHDGQCKYGCIDGYEGDRCQLPGILTLY